MKPIAKTPPMGWNSWDCYGASVTEDEVKKNADYMAANLKKYGWEYIVVDIQWYEPNAKSHEYNKDAALVTDEYGRLMPAENRFPSAKGGAGFKPLADYVHGLGLKFGIHILRGIPRQAIRQNLPIPGTDKTAAEIADFGSICEWNGDMCGVDMTRPGAQEYYNSIFELYASWDVDFVKVDDIARPYHKFEVEAINRAIANTGRNIVLSLSPGDADINEAEHLSEYANMWRMTDDFWDNWDALKKMFDYCRKWFPYIGDGAYPDCDMLPLGRIGIRSLGGGRMTNFTPDEQKLMMTLWCMFKSPLMFGGDMTYNDDYTSSLITNAELLRINQHSYANREAYRRGAQIVWTARVDDDVYAAVFNVSDSEIEFKLQTELVTEKAATAAAELWDGYSLDADNNAIADSVPPHGVRVYRLY